MFRNWMRDTELNRCYQTVLMHKLLERISELAFTILAVTFIGLIAMHNRDYALGLAGVLALGVVNQFREARKDRKAIQEILVRMDREAEDRANGATYG